MNNMKVLFGIIILTLVVIGFLFINRKSGVNLSITPSPVATVAGNDCNKSQIKVDVDTEGAAGSIYAKLTATNISNSSCDVVLGNSISAKYSASNISVSYQDPTDHEEKYSLAPNSKVYSQVRVPNGPQCSGATIAQNVDFYYNETKVKTLPIQACQNINESTAIEIWPVSVTPITQ